MQSYHMQSYESHAARAPSRAPSRSRQASLNPAFYNQPQYQFDSANTQQPAQTKYLYHFAGRTSDSPQKTHEDEIYYCKGPVGYQDNFPNVPSFREPPPPPAPRHIAPNELYASGSGAASNTLADPRSGELFGYSHVNGKWVCHKPDPDSDEDEEKCVDMNHYLASHGPGFIPTYDEPEDKASPRRRKRGATHWSRKKASTVKSAAKAETLASPSRKATTSSSKKVQEEALKVQSRGRRARA